ncbi:hypothetical protein E2C01_032087 [Portunus trituberculatus]|uniref:Uncharacterized protein n=1 Tax=Portunus trituberculatus TaxID=210409 RepID=A0A5B7EZE2_PORTR|nr:hypothetical protein [Portunus trituberculatus]
MGMSWWMKIKQRKTCASAAGSRLQAQGDQRCRAVERGFLQEDHPPNHPTKYSVSQEAWGAHPQTTQGCRKANPGSGKLGMQSWWGHLDLSHSQTTDRTNKGIEAGLGDATVVGKQRL